MIVSKTTLDKVAKKVVIPGNIDINDPQHALSLGKTAGVVDSWELEDEVFHVSFVGKEGKSIKGKDIPAAICKAILGGKKATKK